jgi:EmrB/QacA subfamily drug resistance transporter
MSTVITDPVKQKLLLGAIGFGVVMDGIDGSIVNVALPAMALYFDTDTGTIAWVIICYLLMMAGLLLVFGKFGERGFAKSLFLWGFVIFTIGSAACGIAPTLDILLAARLVQGLGAAMIAAVAPLLCIRFLPREMLGAALGVIAAASSIGFAAGPAIGGIILEHLSWHWIFLVNIPVGIIGILFAARVIPADDPGSADKKIFDYPGAFLLFWAMVLCTFVLEELPARGIADPAITGSALLFGACTVLFILRERSVPDPLVNLRIFRSWQFSSVLLAFLIMNMVFMGVLYLLPFYMTAALGFPFATTGLALLIPPVLIALLGVPFGKWSDASGRRSFAVAGCVVIVLYSAIFALIVPAAGLIPLFLGLVLMGASFGISAGPGTSRIIESAPPGEEGTGSSLMVTSIYFGGVLGTAVYAMIFTLATLGTGGIVDFDELSPTAFLAGFHITMATGLILSLVPLILSAVVPDRKGSV